MHGKRGNRQYSVVRAFTNRWALKRKVYNEHYRSWVEQSDSLYATKAAAVKAGREWLAEGHQNPARRVRKSTGWLKAKAVRIVLQKGRTVVQIRRSASRRKR